MHKEWMIYLGLTTDRVGKHDGIVLSRHRADWKLAWWRVEAGGSPTLVWGRWRLLGFALLLCLGWGSPLPSLLSVLVATNQLPLLLAVMLVTGIGPGCCGLQLWNRTGAPTPVAKEATSLLLAGREGWGTLGFMTLGGRPRVKGLVQVAMVSWGTAGGLGGGPRGHGGRGRCVDSLQGVVDAVVCTLDGLGLRLELGLDCRRFISVWCRARVGTLAFLHRKQYRCNSTCSILATQRSNNMTITPFIQHPKNRMHFINQLHTPPCPLKKELLPTHTTAWP